MSRGEATEGPLGSGTTQGIGHGSSRNRARRFHGVASASWPCLPTQPQFALHPFWEVDLMTASQRPQQLFSPSTAPSLVLAFLSQAWVESLFQGSGWCYGFPAALTIHPSPPRHDCCFRRHRRWRLWMLFFLPLIKGQQRRDPVPQLVSSGWRWQLGKG